MTKTVKSIIGSIFLWIAVLHVPAQDLISDNTGKDGRFENIVIGLIDHSSRDNWQKPEYVLKLFENLSGTKIIDLGCGDGYFTFRLASEGAFVIAADINDNLSQRIKKKLSKEDFLLLSKKIEFRKIPSDSPGLLNEEVDGVLLVNTYHHLLNRIDYFKKLITGLKKEGKIVIVDFKKDSFFGPPSSHKIELRIVLEELKKVGFSDIISDENSLDHQYIIQCMK